MVFRLLCKAQPVHLILLTLEPLSLMTGRSLLVEALSKTQL